MSATKVISLSLILRLFSIVLAFLNSYISIRYLGKSLFGFFSFGVASTTLFMTFAKNGVDLEILRAVLKASIDRRAGTLIKTLAIATPSLLITILMASAALVVVLSLKALSLGIDTYSGTSMVAFFVMQLISLTIISIISDGGRPITGAALPIAYTSIVPSSLLLLSIIPSWSCGLFPFLAFSVLSILYALYLIIFMRRQLLEYYKSKGVLTWQRCVAIINLRQSLRHIRARGFLTLNNAAGGLYGVVDIFVVGLVADPKSVAAYAIIWRYVALLHVVAGVVFSNFSARLNIVDSKVANFGFWKNYWSYSILTACLLIPIQSILIYHAHYFLDIFGIRDNSSALALRVLVIAFTLYYCLGPAGVSLIVFSRERIAFAFSASAFLGSVLIIIVLRTNSLPVIATLFGVAAVFSKVFSVLYLMFRVDGAARS